jgi:hypothetical protein
MIKIYEKSPNGLVLLKIWEIKCEKYKHKHWLVLLKSYFNLIVPPPQVWRQRCETELPVMIKYTNITLYLSLTSLYFIIIIFCCRYIFQSLYSIAVIKSEGLSNVAVISFNRYIV